MLTTSNKMILKIVVTLSILLSIVACESDNNSKANDAMNDSIRAAELDPNIEKIAELMKTDTFPRINYSYIVIKDQHQLANIKEQYKETEDNPSLNKMFCTLNRKERRFLRVGDTVLVADSVVKDMTAYSVFPRVYPAAVNIKKLVMVSAEYQAYACYEYGKQVRFAATNSGKERTQTYPGRYAMVWKSELRISSLDSTWKLPYTWNIHRFAGSAFHKFDMPGYPASHSCLRQFMDDAKWLFKWGEGAKYDTSKVAIHLTGTPVIIMDFFDFRRPRTGPWVALRSNKDVVLKLPDNPMEFEEALIPISQIPKNSRGILPNRSKYLTAEDTLRARGVIREGVTISASVDFNKLRRMKSAKRSKELQEKQNIDETTNTKSSTDDNVIQKELNELENREK